MTSCFLARFDPRGRPCDGRMDRAHLIPAQLIKREVSTYPEVVWDARILVPACRRHHGAFDTERSIRLSREDLPPEVESFAQRNGLDWYLERNYGPRAEAA